MTPQTMTQQILPGMAASAQQSSHEGTNDSAELSNLRQAAFKRAQTHSRAVYILRRLLPVMAGLCCCLYFITGKFSFQYKGIKASVEKINVSKNELKMTNPRLEGHDKKSGSYLVTAATATQKSNTPYVIHLQTVDGKLDHPKNGTVYLKANNGVFNTKKEILELAGDMEIKAPNGMTARLDRAKIVFKKQKITSDRPVFVEMESGTIRADRVEIDGLAKTLIFSDRVRVRLLKSPNRKTNP